MRKLHLTIFVALSLSIQQIYSTQDIKNVEQTANHAPEILNPLVTLQENKQNIEDGKSHGNRTTDIISRVKRQYYPYERSIPIPIPIIIGGGGWYGGRGFGGRGFGGRGFGGRGFGGRGFGGGGFGGRGFGGGGFGGRGIGGGFGGGRGRG